MNRAMDFAEYQKRMKGVRGGEPAARMLWVSLCRYVTQSRLPVSGARFEQYRLPTGRILGLPPEQFKRLPGVTAELVELYRVIYRSLRHNPDELCDCSGEISRKALAKCSGWPSNVAGTVWNAMCRWLELGSREAPTIEQIEAFCDAIQRGEVRRVTTTRLPDLRKWIRHLKR